MDALKLIAAESVKNEIPEFGIGDTIKIGVCGGDGIGPIITEQAFRVLNKLLADEVAAGTSLCSAYALYLCKTNNNDAKAHYVNEENMRRSAPAGKEADAEQTFTPEQAEDMSAENVKKNFKHIIRSIKNWKL